MSRKTLDGIAQAISEHMSDIDEQGELSTWVVGYTRVHIDECDGELEMHYTNSYTCSDGDPNTVLGLLEVTLARVHDAVTEYAEDED